MIGAAANIQGPATVAEAGMESSPTLLVDCISKSYELYRSPGARFVRQLLGRFWRGGGRSFPAVRDVSFKLFPGEALAVLGRNGAGKSTLLQIITGLLTPDQGAVSLPKRVIGLLELGSGFNPDFTGRENIWVNAAIIGLTREEIASKMQDIIDFAEIGDYIDQPVRTYSSGMFLRLAFGVATSASPDLLLVDEVLAVGDIFFRQKCYDRLRAMRSNGTAIVLVTHALSDAAEFCDRGVVLSEGRMAFSGNAVEAVTYYIHHERSARTGKRANGDASSATAGEADNETSVTAVDDWTHSTDCVDLSTLAQLGDPGAAVLEKLLITDLEDHPARIFHQGDWMRIRASVITHVPIERAVLGVAIRSERSILVHGKNGLNVADGAPRDVQPGTRLDLIYDVKLDLDFGEYTLDFALAAIDEDGFANRGQIAPEDLAPRVLMLRSVTGAGAISIISRLRGEIASFSHYGVADLPHRLSAEAHRTSLKREA